MRHVFYAAICIFNIVGIMFNLHLYNVTKDPTWILMTVFAVIGAAVALQEALSAPQVTKFFRKFS